MNDQDLLKKYREENNTVVSVIFLKFLVAKSRMQRRKYPYPKSKKVDKSGDWQITRSLAARAILDGDYEAYPLLALHIRDAFHARHEDETADERKERAIEVMEACLDAVKGFNQVEERSFFRLVDASSEIAINIIDHEKRFPTKDEVMDLAQKKTKHAISTGTEKTKILKAAYLEFLPSKKQPRGTTGNSMKSGFKAKTNRRGN